jgi:hypothetical protein
MSCPTLRGEPYVGERLDEQLADQATRFHDRSDAFRFDERRGVLRLSSVYNWFSDDFVRVAGSVAQYAARYSEALERALDGDGAVEVRYIEWDWTLNDQAIRTTRE